MLNSLKKKLVFNLRVLEYKNVSFNHYLYFVVVVQWLGPSISSIVTQKLIPQAMLLASSYSDLNSNNNDNTPNCSIKNNNCSIQGGQEPNFSIRSDHKIPIKKVSCSRKLTILKHFTVQFYPKESETIKT